MSDPAGFEDVPLFPVTTAETFGGELTELDRWVLDLEGERYKYQGIREARVLERFERVTFYYQRLNRLLDTPAAAAYAPELVRRLREQRDHR